MSTRQYIGARYVPKFFDFNNSTEWVSGFAYEPLTIVTRNGNSYTSKIPVPVDIGAPEANPEYWVNTGNFNSQLEQVSGEVAATRTELAEEARIREENDDALAESVEEVDNTLTSKTYISTIPYKTLDNAAFQGNFYESDRKSLQSMAYNSVSNRYVLLYCAREGSDQGLIVELDSGFNFLRRNTVASSSMGHGNDITYNPNTNKYIIATSENGGLCVMNADTLIVDNHVTLPDLGQTIQVSYDADNDCYYVVDNSGDLLSSLNLYKFDATFETKEFLLNFNPDNMPMPYSGITLNYAQGSCMHDGKFISLFSLLGENLSYGRLALFSEKGDEIININDFMARFKGDELEGVVSANGYLYSVGYYEDKITLYLHNYKGVSANPNNPLPLEVIRYTENSTILDELHENAITSNYYKYFLWFSATHPDLGGGNGVLTGFKANPTAGWEDFESHQLHARRTMVNNVWSDWVYYNLSSRSLKPDIEVISILDAMLEVYPQITAADARCVYAGGSGTTILTFRFKCSEAITSGSATLTGVPGSRTETYGTLDSLDGKTGFVQYSGNTLTVRAAASASQFLSGQIVFIPTAS